MLYFGNREPPLDEVFDDPIVRLLMARDGLPPDEARACVERARAALRERDAHRSARERFYRERESITR
ncbi:MAG TPA: hypothetical protein VGU20_32625 [Stellaceae bacterium]|nr:hypothetical protein [Stellaceae bacterium]